MFELEASQPYQRFRTLSFLDGPDDDQVIPDDISEISHVTWWDSRMPGESVGPPLVERENLTMVDENGFSVASQHTHLISRYPTTSTADSDTPLNHTQPSSQQSPVVGTQQPQYQQPSGRFEYLSFLYPDPNEVPIEPGSISECGWSDLNSHDEEETKSQNPKSESTPLNSLTPGTYQKMVRRRLGRRER